MLIAGFSSHYPIHLSFPRILFRMPASSHAPPFRADQVGSLLRPAHLIEARQQVRKRLITRDELKKIEDAAIREVVALQESAGLQSISDGEFRRQSYIVDFFRRALGSGGLTAEQGDFSHRNEKGEKWDVGTKGNSNWT